MGGRVFGTTVPISKENIKPTLKEFFKELKKIFPNGNLDNTVMLGSAGKKSESGDLDVGLDEQVFANLENWRISQEDFDKVFQKIKGRARTATDRQLRRKALVELLGTIIENGTDRIIVDKKSSGTGTLFCQFTQYDKSGEKLDKDVQIDLMIGDPDWLKFSYYSASYEGNVKGLHRTQLMLSLFLNKEYTFLHNAGVKNKETGKFEVRTPKEAVTLLSKLYGIEFNQDVLADYWKLQEFLKDNLDKDELDKVYDIYLKILDGIRCDVPNDLAEYWLDNQDRLELTGKHLPKESKLWPFRDID